MTVTVTDEGRFRDKAMAEEFADLVDAGVAPKTALERVAGMRASAASEAAEKNFPNSA